MPTDNYLISIYQILIIFYPNSYQIFTKFYFSKL